MADPASRSHIDKNAHDVVRGDRQSATQAIIDIAIHAHRYGSAGIDTDSTAPGETLRGIVHDRYRETASIPSTRHHQTPRKEQVMICATAHGDEMGRSSLGRRRLCKLIRDYPSSVSPARLMSPEDAVVGPQTILRTSTLSYPILSNPNDDADAT